MTVYQTHTTNTTSTCTCKLIFGETSHFFDMKILIRCQITFSMYMSQSNLPLKTTSAI